MILKQGFCKRISRLQCWDCFVNLQISFGSYDYKYSSVFRLRRWAEYVYSNEFEMFRRWELSQSSFRDSAFCNYNKMLHSCLPFDKLHSPCARRTIFHILSYMRLSPRCPAVGGYCSTWRTCSLSDICTTFSQQPLAFDTSTKSSMWSAWGFDLFSPTCVVASRHYAFLFC